jgi:hypothetical protein
VNPGSADGSVPTLNPIDRELYDARAAAFAEKIDRYLQHGSVPGGPRPIFQMPALGDSRSLTQPALANLEAYLEEINGVDRAAPVDPGVRPATFLLIVLAIYGLIALVAGGAWQKLAERGGGSTGSPGGETRA